MKEFHVIWYLLIGLRRICMTPQRKYIFFGFYVLTDTEILWNNTKHKHKLTKFVCQCQSIFPELSVFLPYFSWSLIGQLVDNAALSLATEPALTMCRAWHLDSCLIKYHFLLSFTHFVVLIASLCLMQTFTLRNKERARNAEVAGEWVRESAGIFYHFQLETVLVDFWLHLGPRE